MHRLRKRWEGTSRPVCRNLGCDAETAVIGCGVNVIQPAGEPSSISAPASYCWRYRMWQTLHSTRWERKPDKMPVRIRSEVPARNGYHRMTLTTHNLSTSFANIFCCVVPWAERQVNTLRGRYPFPFLLADQFSHGSLFAARKSIGEDQMIWYTLTSDTGIPFLVGHLLGLSLISFQFSGNLFSSTGTDQNICQGINFRFCHDISLLTNIEWKEDPC